MALAAFALVLWSGSAAAQNDVTFQVNLQPFITSCQFNPATETAFVRGSFQDPPFNLANPLTPVGNGIYAATVPVATEGPITYKFYVGQTATPSTEGILGWENGSDRTYTVTAGAQTVPVAEFNKPVANACGAVDRTYDLRFRVDMNVQIGRGAFNPATQSVAVAGTFTGWDGNSALTLTESSIDPGVFTGVLQDRVFATPTTTAAFKYIIYNNADPAVVVTYEQPRVAVTQTNSGSDGGDRRLILTGNEPDTNGDGVLDYTYDNDGNAETAVYFSDADASLFLDSPASVTFNVDMRPAQYRILDAGSLPAGEGGGAQTAINTVSINGPVAGESTQDGGPAGGIGDWAAWGEPLAAITSRQLSDPDGDGVWSITLNYEAGATRTPIAKFSVNGIDNEAGFQGDHRFPLAPGVNVYTVAFGCVRQADGTYTDRTGGNPPAFTFYDEYLVPNNTATPPTCAVVRNGGTVAVENGPAITGLEIGAAYPNPTRDTGRIELTADRAMAVTVRVYDVTGRQVATLLDGRQVGAGTTTLDLDTARLASGVYVLRVEADGQVASRRLTVTR